MARFNAVLSSVDREAINHAVQQAEARTSAEIVPVIAVSSGRYDRSEDIVGLWFGIGGLFAVWALSPAVTDAANSWATPEPAGQFVAMAAAVVAGFLIGAVVASRVDPLRRLFTPRQQMHDEVQARARAVFFDQRVHHTLASSGILIYVSLFERMATVLADQSVLGQLGPDRLSAVCHELTHRLQAGPPSAALCETIHSLGQPLAEILPRAENDLNELCDAVVFLE